MGAINFRTKLGGRSHSVLGRNHEVLAVVSGIIIHEDGGVLGNILRSVSCPVLQGPHRAPSLSGSQAAK